MMYNLNNILPFLDKAPLIRKSRGVYKTEDVLIDSSWFDKAKEGNFNTRNKVWDAYLVYPIGKLVIKAPISEIVHYLRTEHKYWTCNVYEVDYTKVASVISVVNGKAMYPYLSGFVSEDVTSTEYILKSTGDYRIVMPSWVGSYNPEDEDNEKTLSSIPASTVAPLREALSLDDLGVGVRASMSREGEAPYVSRLESYFSGGYSTNRTPLLVGGTAVAKSSVVKTLCRKHNMRMVDIRTAFITRLDLEGLSEAVDLGDSVESFNCPMDQMVMCTDAYVDYCRSAVKKVSLKIEELRNSGKDEDKEEAMNLELQVLPKFVEGAKVPVLFFDEITRGEASVRQALTKILSDKAFMGYPMKYARFIAATNSTGSDDDIFLTKTADDSAFYDRFESMFINPEDAFPGWLNWAEMPSSKHEGDNIHPIIREYIDGTLIKAYSQDEIMDRYEEDQDLLALTSSSFPNYRTWEMVSDYLYANEETKKYSFDYISGLIGKTAASELIDSDGFKSRGWAEREASKDKMRDIVNEGMESGTPTMLIAPSSVGKTSRVKKAVKDRGALFIEVNLAEQDRTDLLGFPVQITINRMILGSDVSMPADLREELDAELSQYRLPQKVTTKAPKASVAEQFKKAYATGQDVVIFFDEINRVMNPSTMSVVFDACSDNRIFGVDFDPSRVKIFAACNLGDNMADAQPLDPAFAARFSIYKKTQYDEDDVNSFLEYAEGAEFDPILLQYLKDMPKEDLLRTISSVETRTLEVSAASTRALEDFSKFLKDRENNGSFTGTVLFPDSVSQTQCRAAMRGDSDITKIFSDINSKLNNWSAINSKQTIEVTTSRGKEVVTAEEVRSLAFDAMKMMSDPSKDPQVVAVTLKNVLRLLYSLDQKVVSDRSKISSYFLGADGANFNQYYNKVSGTQIVLLKIEDCIDINNIAPYVKQVLSICKKVSDYDTTAARMTFEFYDVFKDSLSTNHYRELINSVLGLCINPDMKFAYMKNLAMDLAKGDKIIMLAENKDPAFIVSILTQIGLSASKEEVTQKISNVSTKKPVMLS